MLLIALLVPPTGKPACGQFLLQGFDLRFVLEQELNVVPAGEAKVTAAVLVRQIREKAQGLDAGEARRAGADRVQAVAGLRHMAENAGRQVLVVFPLAVVLLDQRRQELLVRRRADVGKPGRLGGRAHLSPPWMFWKKMYGLSLGADTISGVGSKPMPSRKAGMPTR